jgi:hypothetical protein
VGQIIEEQRRAFPRYCYGEELQVKSDEGIYSLTGIDLALGGCRVSGEFDLAEGTGVRIYLPLKRKDKKGSRFCAVSGSVAWQHGPAAGIRFEDLDDDTWGQLAAYLSTLPEAPNEWKETGVVLDAPEPFAELRLDDTESEKR